MGVGSPVEASRVTLKDLLKAVRMQYKGANTWVVSDAGAAPI